MKIVNLEEFRAFPAGIVFMKYSPCVFGELSVKGKTWEYDFLTSDCCTEIESNDSSESSDILDAAEKDSSYSIKMDFDCFGRDGSFEDKQLFAVYEQADLDGLINTLSKCKGI